MFASLAGGVRPENTPCPLPAKPRIGALAAGGALLAHS